MRFKAFFAPITLKYINQNRRLNSHFIYQTFCPFNLSKLDHENKPKTPVDAALAPRCHLAGVKDLQKDRTTNNIT